MSDKLDTIAQRLEACNNLLVAVALLHGDVHRLAAEIVQEAIDAEPQPAWSVDLKELAGKIAKVQLPPVGATEEVGHDYMLDCRNLALAVLGKKAEK